MTYSEARPPFIVRETPPYRPKQSTTSIVDWDTVEDWAKAHPGEWFRVIHKYSSQSSARFSAAQQGKKRGLETRVTVQAPQPDGRVGIFIRYPNSK